MRNSLSKESRMSATSEEPSPANPFETFVTVPRRPSERPEPRLAAVNDPPLPRMLRTETRTETRTEPRSDLRTELRTDVRAEAIDSRIDALRAMPAQGDRLETAMHEFVRRQLRPEAVPEPAGLKRDARRQIMFTGAVVVAIAAVVALVFVTLFPRQKDIIQSFAAAVPAAPAQSIDIAAASPPPSRATLAENAGESFTHEQSERLLQQFMQWRQNVALTTKP
jgi:hypothetical protein